MNKGLVPEEAFPDAQNSAETTAPHTAQKHFRPLGWGLISVGAILLVSLGAIAALVKSRSATQVETSPQITVLPVESRQVEPVESYQVLRIYTGEVAHLRTSELGFELGGKLIRITVDEGDRVSPGMALAYLDTSSLEARKREVEATRDRARAQLRELETGARQEDIDAARAQRDLARAQLRELETGARTEDIDAARATVTDLNEQLSLARLKRDRRETLHKDGAISLEQFDEAVTEASALQARLQQAQSQLDELLAGTRAEQIEAQKARLQAAQSELDELLAGTRTEQIDAQGALVRQQEASISTIALEMEKSVLKAPFAGTISARRVDEGTVVSAGQSILRLVEDETIEVRIGVPVSAAFQLQPGKTLPLEIRGRTYQATVLSTLPELDSSTRTQTAILTLERGVASQVVAGEIARLKLTETIPMRGYWLPATALVRGERGLWSSYVLVEAEPSQISSVSQNVERGTPHRVEQRDVEVLHTEGDRVFVRGTLQSGDSVIISGTQRIVPGQLVRPISVQFD